jgi:hypothetical protein
MQVRTTEGSVIADVDGTFEDAYLIAMYFWEMAGDAQVHMDGLQITHTSLDDGDEEAVEVLLTINYTTY